MGVLCMDSTTIKICIKYIILIYYNTFCLVFFVTISTTKLDITKKTPIKYNSESSIDSVIQ